jgi:light-regulated signal transduction histidine kinase (bacteriophytochrome)
MNSLLKRQIRKYLAPEQEETTEKFLAAVNESYKTYEDHIAMLQRAIKLSSDELFEANQKLRDEASSLKEINSNLEFMLTAMNMDAGIATDFTSIVYIKQQSAEIVRINRQREELLKSLELQNQSLNEYAHVVSHDLKAPLRNINTLITWVIEDNHEKLDEQSVVSLELIQSNVEKMDLLIKGILDYSSIDKLESEQRMVDLNDLVNEILHSIILPGTILVKFNTILPVVFGNYYHFQQLFQNIIDNAIKYNDKENGIIEIGSRENKHHIEFYIKDNGKGIPAAYFEKIFNVFTKLESDDKSSGIGLSIVKKVIQFYDGKIWLESTENIGTTFFFTLRKVTQL